MISIQSKALEEGLMQTVAAFEAALSGLPLKSQQAWDNIILIAMVRREFGPVAGDEKSTVQLSLFCREAGQTVNLPTEIVVRKIKKLAVKAGLQDVPHIIKAGSELIDGLLREEKWRRSISKQMVQERSINYESNYKSPLR